MLSEESDDDNHGYSGYRGYIEQVANNEPHHEQSVERKSWQNSTEQPHDSIPEVFIVYEESLTDSLVTRENHSSSSRETRTVVICDSMAISMGMNHAFLEDNSDPEIIIGSQQLLNDDSLSDTLIYQPDELPQSPIHILPEKMLVLHLSNSFGEMIEAFSDPEILNKTLAFRHLLPDSTVEKGTSSGVIRDVSSFWA